MLLTYVEYLPYSLKKSFIICLNFVKLCKVSFGTFHIIFIEVPLFANATISEQADYQLYLLTGLHCI